MITYTEREALKKGFSERQQDGIDAMAVAEDFRQLLSAFGLAAGIERNYEATHNLAGYVTGKQLRPVYDKLVQMTNGRFKSSDELQDGIDTYNVIYEAGVSGRIAFNKALAFGLQGGETTTAEIEAHTHYDEMREAYDEMRKHLELLARKIQISKDALPEIKEIEQDYIAIGADEGELSPNERIKIIKRWERNIQQFGSWIKSRHFADYKMQAAFNDALVIYKKDWQEYALGGLQSANIYAGKQLFESALPKNFKPTDPAELVELKNQLRLYDVAISSINQGRNGPARKRMNDLLLDEAFREKADPKNWALLEELRPQLEAFEGGFGNVSGDEYSQKVKQYNELAKKYNAAAKRHRNIIGEAIQNILSVEFGGMTPEEYTEKKAELDALEGAGYDQVIDNLLAQSPVTQAEADAWVSENLEIPTGAAKKFSRIGYPVAQVKKDAAEFYRMARGKINKKVILKANGARRAHHKWERQRTENGIEYVSAIAVDGDFDKRTLWHEMGHQLEYVDPKANDLAVNWIKSRAISQEIKPLNRIIGRKIYDRDEVGMEDHFIDPYVGKIYGRTVSEVWSMTLQELTSPDRLRKLHEADPEMLNLVLGYLAQDDDEDAA